jgi:hypothetical protein
VIKEFEEKRPFMDFDDHTGWELEFNIRFNAMVEAMKRLDDEGVFSLNQSRSGVLVNVEVLGGDQAEFVNTARLFGNSEQVIQDYVKWYESL